MKKIDIVIILSFFIFVVSYIVWYFRDAILEYLKILVVFSFIVLMFSIFYKFFMGKN